MDKELKQIPIGSWEVLKEGSDAVILTFGTTIPLAMKAATQLEKEGYSVKVVNARFIKPMDENMLNALLGSKVPILTIEEAVLQGGFGSAVMEHAQEQGFYGAIIDRMGIPDYFIEHGSVDELLEEIHLTAEAAVKKIKRMTPKKQKRA